MWKQMGEHIDCVFRNPTRIDGRWWCDIFYGRQLVLGVVVFVNRIWFPTNLRQFSMAVRHVPPSFSVCHTAPWQTYHRFCPVAVRPSNVPFHLTPIALQSHLRQPVVVSAQPTNTKSRRWECVLVAKWTAQRIISFNRNRSRCFLATRWTIAAALLYCESIIEFCFPFALAWVNNSWSADATHPFIVSMNSGGSWASSV